MSNKQIIEYLLLGSAGISVLFIFIGFYKPWVALWWEDTQHRKKVLQYYGTAAILFYVLYWIVKIINF